MDLILDQPLAGFGGAPAQKAAACYSHQSSSFLIAASAVSGDFWSPI